ncbi:MAG TPA: hypothetical protein VF543_03045 [Pyrinomonadaceae bacterium]|jgi:hypothetical protein
MRKIIYGLLLILVAATAGVAQINNSAPEYGTLFDIKDMSRVYVYSDDLESRELILQELSKEPKLQVVGKLEEAEFFIFYGRSFFDTGYSSFGGIFGGVFGNVTTKNTAEVGEYYVLMRGDKIEGNSYRPRILWGKQNLRVIRGNALIKTKLPAKDVTRKFMKELQKVRGDKK